MKPTPSRDISGKVEGECRNRIREGEEERQKEMRAVPHDSFSPHSPSWTKDRTKQPAVWGGRV